MNRRAAWRPPSTGEGLWFAAGSALAYLVAWWINRLIAPLEPLYFGVHVVFLPAGIKLLAILVGHHWGALGVAAMEYALRWVSTDSPPDLVSVLELLVWVGATYVMVEGILRSGRVPFDLRGIRARHLVGLAAATAVTNAVASNAFALVTGRLAREEFWHLALVWLVGDIVGALLVLGLLQIAVRGWRRPRG